MDCGDISWGALLYSYALKVATLQETAVPLPDLNDLLHVIQPLPASSKVICLLRECEKRFPQLGEELAGEFEDAAEAGAHSKTGSSHPLQAMQARCQRTGRFLLSLAKLCLSQRIYPAIFFSEFLKHLHATGKRVRYGSGVSLESPGRLPCANLSPQYSKCCRQPARRPCPHCELVAYCSEECRKAHWDLVHEGECARALQDASQRDTSRRQALSDNPNTPHPHPALLWDFVPAFGVLGNVGDAHLPNPFRILLMDVVDLNNVIETLHQLDVESLEESHCQIFIHTIDDQALARNLILCSLLLRMASGELDDSAVDAVIAVWYSADLTPSQYLLLMDTIVELLNTVSSTAHCDSFQPPSCIFGPDRNILDIQTDMVKLDGEQDELVSVTMKQIECSGSSVSVHMHGIALYKYLIQMGLPSFEPEAVSREAVLGKYDRKNGLDGFLTDAHYSALEKFGETGLLLPFAFQSYGNHHCLPNPTLVSAIDNPRVGWSAITGRLEPLCGWPILQVTSRDVTGRRNHGVPGNDLYGSLYFYIRSRILSAVAKIRACKISVQFTDHDMRVDCWKDLIAFGPGPKSIHIARVDCSADEDISHTLLWRSWFHRLLVDGGIVIVVQDIKEYLAPDLKAADWLFQKFVSRFESDKFTEKLGRLARYDALDINIFGDLFLQPDAFLEEEIREFQQLKCWELPSVSSSPVDLPCMPYRTPLPTAVLKPVRVSLTQKQEKTEGKAAETTAEPKQAWQGVLAPITTPEECYMHIMFTLDEHRTKFMEVRKRPQLAARAGDEHRHN